MFFIIVERVDVYDQIWILGDDFVSDTVGEFLQLDDQVKPYLRDQYDVKVLCSTSLSLNKSTTARLHNNLVNTLIEKLLLPKAIIFVLDGHMIKTVNHDKLGISEVFGQLTKNLAVSIHRMILAHKDNMPKRSKKDHYTTILWTEIPLHCNFPDNSNVHCRKFNKCLESVVQMHPEMAMLKMES